MRFTKVLSHLSVCVCLHAHYVAPTLECNMSTFSVSREGQINYFGVNFYANPNQESANIVRIMHNTMD